MPKKEPETTETHTISPRGEIHFFPNTAEGAPFSVEASSREEAEQRNQEHLDTRKETSPEDN